MTSGMPTTTTIPTPEPFDFHLTAGNQTYYRGRAGADLYADGTYYRALRRGREVLGIAAKPAPGGLEVSLPNGGSESDLSYAVGVVSRLLGLDVDLAGFYGLLEDDEVLGAAVGSMRGLRPTGTETVFEALVKAIVAQQISGAVARTIRDGLVDAYGTPISVEGHDLQAFPTPETLVQAGQEELRGQKLSARKAEYILDTAQRTLDGSIDPARLAAMDDEEVVVELTKVRGVGRWTAEWVLMGALGRMDVFPAGDLALKRVVSELYFDAEPINEQQLSDFAERWKPYRGLATTYLFAHLRQQRVAARP